MSEQPCDVCGEVHNWRNPVRRDPEVYRQHGLLWVDEAAMPVYEHCERCGVLFDVRWMSDEEIDSHNDGTCSDRRWGGPFFDDPDQDADKEL